MCEHHLIRATLIPEVVRLISSQFNISEETILEMLKYKRYDLISQIKRYDIPNSIAEKIWEEYPFDSLPFPRILASCKEFSINHLEEYPLQETLLFYLYYKIK